MQMKKILVILVALIGLGLSAKAQINPNVYAKPLPEIKYNHTEQNKIK